MATIEQRVSALEERDAQRHNVALFNALRTTQLEQGRVLEEYGRILAEHTRVLGEHTRILVEHGGRMDAIDSKLGILTVGMHTIETMLRHLIEAEGRS